MDRGTAMYESIKTGKKLEVREYETLADSLQGGVLLDNKYTYNIVQEYVDDLILVTEEEIKYAIKYIFDYDHFMVEAAAFGVATLLSKKIDFSKDNEKVAVIITGTNISRGKFMSVVKS